jgi:septum formation inhibitor MinC
MLRGTATGLEFVFSGRTFDEAWAEIAERLAERPEFYRGSQATAIFDGEVPDEPGLERFLSAVSGYGITLRGLHGGASFEPLAERHALAYLGEPPKPTVASFERKRAARAGKAQITERARSLDADFAGARADIAKRRARGETSVPRVSVAASKAAAAAAAALPPSPATLYHRGTLRGGQSAAQLGNIVVVGDVNPGAELVATGDIVVFGAFAARRTPARKATRRRA